MINELLVPDYKNAKERVKKWVKRINAIEKEIDGKIAFENGYLELRYKTNHLPKTDCLLKLLEIFISIFNNLNNDAKTIIYLSFFKNKQNEFIAQNLNISLNKLTQMKHTAVIELTEALEMELLLRG